MRKIEQIGYERLRIYFLSRRDFSLPGRPFRPGTSYKDIISLYECDALLRSACFSAVGQFEILLRNAMSEALSRSHGSHPYFQLAAFKDAAANLDALSAFTAAYQRSRDPRAKHYRQTYGEPILPPIWTMKELLTFGTASRILQGLSGPLRTAISADFGIPKDTLFLNWVECLVDLRNICAHHDRLFNRRLQKQPIVLAVANLPVAPRNTLKAILECLDHLLDRRGMPAGIVAKANAIIARHLAVRPSEAGF